MHLSDEIYTIYTLNYNEMTKYHVDNLYPAIRTWFFNFSINGKYDDRTMRSIG